jgi:hypothetical protein
MIHFLTSQVITGIMGVEENDDEPINLLEVEPEYHRKKQYSRFFLHNRKQVCIEIKLWFRSIERIPALCRYPGISGISTGNC